MEHRRVALACLVAGTAAVAAAGWSRAPAEAPSIRIVDIRPLPAPTAALRDVLSHHVRVRVATGAWPLRPPRSDASGLDGRPALRRWRLYLDGRAIGDSSTDEFVTPYLRTGTHWLAAELRGSRHERLRPDVWSEPVVLYMPRRVRRR